MSDPFSSVAKVASANLEKAVTGQLTGAVEGFAKSIFPGVFDSGNTLSTNRDDGYWDASSYASGLANGDLRPKLKFLFKVEFIFEQTPEVIAVLNSALPGIGQSLTFNVKTIDKPKIDFEYDEVNQYNYRTKVLRGIKHRELSLVLNDDVGNRTFEFFKFFMIMNSGIVKRSAFADHYGDFTTPSPQTSPGHGMAFSKGITADAFNDTAQRSIIDIPTGNLIKAIKLRQVYLKPTTPSLQSAAKEVIYVFVNPKIVAFDMDDHSHEASEASIATLQFNYDYLGLVSENLLDEIKDGDVQLYSATSPTAPGEISPRANSTQQSAPVNPLVAAIGAIGGRAASQLYQTTVGKYVGLIPGGSFINSGIGNLVGGVASSGSISGITAGLGAAGQGMSSIGEYLKRPSGTTNVPTEPVPLTSNSE